MKLPFVIIAALAAHLSAQTAPTEVVQQRPPLTAAEVIARMPADGAIATMSAADIIATEPNKAWTSSQLDAYYNHPAMKSRVTALIAQIMTEVTAGRELAMEEQSLLYRYWYSIKAERKTPETLAFIKEALKTRPEMATNLRFWVVNQADYDAAKAQPGFQIRNVRMLDVFPPVPMALALQYKDYAYVDAMDRSRAMKHPVLPEMYNQYLVWKLPRLETDRARYNFLQDELDTVVAASTYPEADPLVIMLRQKSDIYFARLRRKAAIDTPVP